MSTALTSFLKACLKGGEVAGVIGIGGSGGTALIAPAFRSLPIGLPKAIISTVATVNPGAYIGSTDLVLFPSVVDVAGLNGVLRTILGNAASATAGMALQYISSKTAPQEGASSRPTVALTMFGVTTPCVDEVRRQLEQDSCETLVFHATGTGGKAMEDLISGGFVQGVIDVTTTEVADLVAGGVLACDSTRFEAAIEKGIPLVLSLGALDMVNFGAADDVPEKYKSRKLHCHNAQVTLMRADAAESTAMARFIADKLGQAKGPFTVLIPEGGLSALDAPGQPFHDPEVSVTLFNELEKGIKQTATQQVRRLPLHINDPQFASALVSAYYELSGGPPKSPPPVTDPPTVAPGRSWCETLDEGTLRGRTLQHLRGLVDSGVPIIGAGAGTGISAKFEEAGGADLIIIYNSGRFRMAGRGSLAGLMPYKDANGVVLEMAEEVLPVVKSAPVLAGVCATDPFRRVDRFLQQLIGLGFAGVQNFPTVGLIDGQFRQNLEETGMGYQAEVDMIACAHKLGLLTTPYAFDVASARAMAKAGADIVVAHMGLTTAGSIGAKTALTLEESVERVQAIADAARAVNQDVLVLCHGGPISRPDDAAYVLQHTRGVHGFYGASSMERLPVEQAITSCVRQYKAITLSAS